MAAISTLIRYAALSGFIGVAAGAFGAHGLKTHVDPSLLPIWHTAVLYQLVHTLALLLVAALGERLTCASLKWIGALFAAGIIIFSGSLYILVLSDIKWLGAITPIGGVCFLAGWLCLAFSAGKQRQA